MTETTSTARGKAFFLPSVAGDIFVTYFPPIRGAQNRRRDVVFVPPFADEMNKARRMIALQAIQLSNIGVGVMVPDLYGTGDSMGDFTDARWETWKSDLRSAMDWLQQQGSESISVIGLRSGGLLIMDLLQQSDVDLERVVLWQPVIGGEVMMTQFLRLRTTASVMSGKGKRESTKDLRAALTAGTPIEVAGYELAPKLVASIDGVKLTSSPPKATLPIHWLELTQNSDSPLLPTSQRVIESWRSKGGDVSTRQILGNPFWEGEKVTVVPELLAATTTIFEAAG